MPVAGEKLQASAKAVTERSKKQLDEMIEADVLSTDPHLDD